MSNCTLWQVNPPESESAARCSRYLRRFSVPGSAGSVSRFPTALVLSLIANAYSRYEAWWQLCRHLCKMGQTRLFPASIMMFRERVRRTSLTIGGWTWEPQGNPGKNLTKRHSPASRKKWRSPASPSLRGTGRQPEKTRSDRVITASRRSYFLESSRSKRPSTFSRLSLVSTLFNRIE